MVAHWKLDATAGTRAYDTSGFDNTGIVKGGGAWTTGQVGGALQLDGVNDYVDIPHSTSVNIGGTQITLSAWIKFTSTGTWQTALAKVNSDSSHVAPYFTYMLGVTPSDEARFFLAVGGGTTFVDVRSHQRLVSGNWYHLAGVYDGVSLNVYVNGVLDGVAGETRSITTRTSSLRIGVGGTANEPLQGSVDDVRIYNSGLPATAIAALADLESPAVPTQLTAEAKSDTEVNLEWAWSIDTDGPVGYRVYRDGTRIADTENTSYTDFGLFPSTVYSYTVAAYDVAGNVSAQSAPSVATTLARPVSYQGDLTSGLVGHWELNEASGSTAVDSSGFNNTGIVQGGAVWASGQVGGALQLDGVNDYVDIPHSTSVDIGGTQITLSAWIKFTSTGTWQTGLAKVNSDNGHVAPYFTYMLGVTPSDEARFFVAVGGGTTFVDVRSRLRLVSGNWYHLTGVYDGVSLRIYVNGVLDGVTGETGSITTRASSLKIGVGGTVNEPLKGLVDDLRIYHRALADTDISALYLERDGTLPPILDTESPSVPTQLIAEAKSTIDINLTWAASTDNVGTMGYRVSRNGTPIADTEKPSYADSGLAAATTYWYTVAAYDGARNFSAPSTVVSTTTLSPPGTPTSGATWSQPIAIAGAPAVTTTVTGDFNGDGIADVAALEGGKHSGVKVFAWFESPNFVKHDFNTKFSTAEFLGSAAAADINRDGRIDLVFTMDHHSYAAQEGWVYWAQNPGGGATGDWPIHLIRYLPTGTEHINDMAVADVDNDGRLDVVIRHLGTNSVRILFQDALPSTWTLKTIPVRPREGLAIADLDGDGRNDLALNGFWLAGPTDPRTGLWSEFSIDQTFYTQPDVGLNNAAKVGVGDIDRDGRPDVLISTAEGDLGKLAWYRNSGNPRTTSWEVNVLEGISTGMHQAELGDIDLDGDLDIMNGFAFGQTGIYVYLMTPTSFTRKTVTTSLGLYFGKLADLDGDGDLDIVGPTSYAGPLYVYKNQ